MLDYNSVVYKIFVYLRHIVSEFWRQQYDKWIQTSISTKYADAGACYRYVKMWKISAAKVISLTILAQKLWALHVISE